jgi:hypothetical protein
MALASISLFCTVFFSNVSYYAKNVKRCQLACLKFLSAVASTQKIVCAVVRTLKKLTSLANF